MARCGLNIISHDRLTEHDGYILVNSFIPPVNSRAFDTIANHVPGRGADFFEKHTTGARTAPISCYIAATDKMYVPVLALQRPQIYEGRRAGK